MADRLNHDDYTIAWIAVLPIEASNTEVTSHRAW
jgi:hypothetical protein